MCGIAGVIHFDGTSVQRTALEGMASVLSHRGPDHQGVWLNADSNVGLCHRRLSIIDLSSNGNQPMQYSDGRFTIVYNGEIYNYLELRSDLEKDGVEFRTRTDTEVLLALFKKYGLDCINMLDGMFAFAIWDADKSKLFCARDRFGEKPFFYLRKGSSFYFASEIKAIKTVVGSLKPDLELIQQYLSFERKFENTETCFSDVFALAPASTLTVGKGHFIESTYWGIDLDKQQKSPDYDECISEFRRILNLSVLKRLRSDVPYGSSLSGGLDSSAIVGLIAQQGQGEFSTFSARFDWEKDEGRWISEVVNKNRISNFEIWPSSNEMASAFSDLIWHHEYPVMSASVFAQWSVMKLASDRGVKVLLDGQGADEYLAGYDELKYFAIWDLFHQGRFNKYFKERKLFIRNYGAHGSLGLMFVADPILKLFGFKRPVCTNGYSLKEQLKHYTTRRLGELLRYADRNSMAHSLEVRLPFLSHELVEFVFSLPGDLIYRDGKTKFVLREAVKDVLPDPVYKRIDKIGFAPPQDDWMKSKEISGYLQGSNVVLNDFGLKPSANSFANLSTAEMLKLFI